MGSELVAFLDVSTIDARRHLVETVLDLAGGRAMAKVSITRPTGGAPALEVLETVVVASADRHSVASLLARQEREAVFVSVDVETPLDERWGFEAGVYMNPPGLVATNYPHDVELELKAWPSCIGAPPPGMTELQHLSLAQQLYQLDIVEQLSAVNGVTRCRVVAEQQVFNPVSFRLVFHAEPSMFAGDLRDMIELALRGGRSYQDWRSLYEPLLGLPAESMDFCGRSRREVEALRARLQQLAPALDERGALVVTDELVRRAASRSGRYAVFENGTGGLGVRGLPPRSPRPDHDYGRFPVAFLDDFYLDLAELQLGR